MTRREKLLDKMRTAPGSIRFEEVDALLRHYGFVLFNQRGSHCTYHRADGRVLTMVRPHARHTACHVRDIRKLLEALDP
jgi:predicted RNA binding protein YcfA (HicA-like mRNA interferase family)